MTTHARDRKTWLVVQSHGYEERSLEFFEELIQVTEERELVQVLLQSVRGSAHLLDCAYQVFAPLLSVEVQKEVPSPIVRPRHSRRPAPQRQSRAHPHTKSSLNRPLVRSASEGATRGNEGGEEISKEMKNQCLSFLHDPFLARGFRQFLHQQHCEEQFTFWRSVETFRDEYPRLSSPFR